jgi:DNA-binding Lrp family transcriptional regulator
MEMLDEIDRRMIDELRRDGRVSVPVLAERVGIGRATAYTRFDRLVDDGVITGFRAQVDPASVGLEVSAMVLANVEQARWREAHDQIAAIESVEWIGMATGAFDFMIRVRCRDLRELRDVVLTAIHDIDEVTAAQSVVLLDESDVSR